MILPAKRRVELFEATLRGFSIPEPLYAKKKANNVELSRFPLMAAIYLALCECSNTYPVHWKDFCDIALPRTLAKLASQNINVDIEFVLGRLWRSWGALVREHHAMLLAHTIFSIVHRDVDLDLQHKIDLLVSYRGHRVGMRVRIDTERAAAYANSKDGKKPVPIYEVVDVIAQKSGHVVGPVHLVSDWVMQGAASRVRSIVNDCIASGCEKELCGARDISQIPVVQKEEPIVPAYGEQLDLLA